MVMALLRDMKDLIIGLFVPGKEKVLQDLEHAMRTKGGMTQEEETKLRVFGYLPTAGFVLGSGLGSYVGWFGFGSSLGPKMFGVPPMTGLTRFSFTTGYAFIMGKIFYHYILCRCPEMVLDTEDGHMKMELANIILTKHSDNEYLVEAVKRHFFAEHLFIDLHQDRPLFRWHPRHSYIDSAFVERVKEIEVSNSDDQARSISRQTTANTKSFGDLMEDPLACVLGSPGDMETSNSSENSSTVLKRSESQARKRSHRHHH